MILSRRVALNGVQLDSVDSRILVQGVETGTAKNTINAVSRFGGAGQRITATHRDTLDVTVRFSIHAKNSSMQDRSEVFEKVTAWAAAGGWLTVNFKPGRRIHVVLAQAPAEGDQWKWTSVYAITFRAFGVPYWQQSEPATGTATGSSISTSLTVAGSEETVMDFTFKHTNSSACNTFSITAGGNTIAFSSLGLAKNETLIFDHTEEGRLRIRILNGTTYRSVLDKRTEESADDLAVKPGAVAVSVTAQRSGTLTLSCAGRYT